LRFIEEHGLNAVFGQESGDDRGDIGNHSARAGSYNTLLRALSAWRGHGTATAALPLT